MIKKLIQNQKLVTLLSYDASTCSIGQLTILLVLMTSGLPPPVAAQHA